MTKLLTAFLTPLFTGSLLEKEFKNKETVSEDACKIGHVISDKTFVQMNSMSVSGPYFVSETIETEVEVWYYSNVSSI